LSIKSAAGWAVTRLENKTKERTNAILVNSGFMIEPL
jgi:hypothetical protein